MAGIDAVLPSSRLFDGGRGSKEGSLIGELPSDGDRYFWAVQTYSIVTCLSGPVSSVI